MKPISVMRQTNPSPAAFLLPTTIGMASKDRFRDPRVRRAPAISISGKNDSPWKTPQYEKRDEHLAERSEQIKLNPKTMTKADLSHLTRVGNDRTRLQISFRPHRIDRPKTRAKQFSAPGPATYHSEKEFDRILYAQEPRVRIRPLVGPTIKREGTSPNETNERTLVPSFRPFWTTIGTRTANSRLPNAPISTIHQRFKAHRTASMPGPAIYPIFSSMSNKCPSRGVTIAPKLATKRLLNGGLGPAMIDRTALDKGVKRGCSSSHVPRLFASVSVQNAVEKIAGILYVIALVAVLAHVHSGMS